MADAPKNEPPYLKRVAKFYFSPQLRSVATLIYFSIFAYFTLYYADNIVLVGRFFLYILLGHTALSGISFLFAGLIFVVSLSSPFFISIYSIFVLHQIWARLNWSLYAKWTTTCCILVGSIVIVLISDSVSRWAAMRPAMQSFIEDANLTDRL